MKKKVTEQFEDSSDEEKLNVLAWDLPNAPGKNSACALQGSF